MSRIVNLYHAKTHLSDLVDRAAAGEEIIIAKAGTAMARLVPLQAAREPRVPGGWEGKMLVGNDFDDLLPVHLIHRFEADEPPDPAR
jgi:prevent-host-death family protein